MAGFSKRRKINPHFLEVARSLHNLNPEIIEGYQDHDGSKGIAFIKETIQSIFNDHGYTDLILEKIEPIPLPIQLARMKTRVADIASPDIVPHTFHFKKNGIPFQVNMSLPVPIGNKLRIRGTTFTIVRTIKNTVITVEKDGTIVIDMIKKNVTISSINYNVLVNDSIEVATVPYSATLHKPSDKGPYRIPIFAYDLLYRGYRTSISPHLEFHFKADKKDKKEYTTFSVLRDNTIAVSVKTEHLTPQLKQQIKQLMYCIDCLGEDMDELLNIDSFNMEDEYEFWFTVICLLSSNGKPVAYNSADITSHLNGVRTLNERATLKVLETVDVYVSTFNELLAHIATNYASILLEKRQQNRRIMVQEDLYEPIINAFTLLANSLTKTHFTDKTIGSVFQNKLREGTIFQLVTKENQVLMLTQMDNVFTGFHNVKEQKRAGILESMIPSEEDMFHHTINIIPKNTPYVSTINPYLQISNGVLPYTKEMRFLSKQIAR